MGLEPATVKLRPAFVGAAYAGTVELWEDEKHERPYTPTAAILTCLGAGLVLSEGKGLTVTTGKFVVELTEAQTLAVGRSVVMHFSVKVGTTVIVRGAWPFEEP